MHSIEFKQAFDTKVLFVLTTPASAETGEAIKGTIKRLVADKGSQHYEVLTTGGATFDVTEDQIVGHWDNENEATAVVQDAQLDDEDAE